MCIPELYVIYLKFISKKVGIIKFFKLFHKKSIYKYNINKYI